MVKKEAHLIREAMFVYVLNSLFILFLHFLYPVDLQLTILIHISTTALVFPTNKWKRFSSIYWSISGN